MSPIPDTELTPQVWCQRMLGALTRWRLEARKSQRLELLLHEIAARTALRGQIRHADPTDATRYGTRLRAVGVELDKLPRQAYQILVSRQTVVVEGSAGCYQAFTTDSLAPHLQSLVTRRDTPTLQISSGILGDRFLAD